MSPFDPPKRFDLFATGSEDTKLGPDAERQRKLPAKTPARLADLLPRLLSGLALMGLALLAWWAGGAIFVFIWLLAAIAVFCEWQRIIDGPRKIARFFGGGIALVLVALFTARDDFAIAGLCMAGGAGLVAVLAYPGRSVWAAAGYFYAATLIGALCLLSGDIVFGPRAILWLFAIVWGTDICAYFGGRLLGGPKLWARVSPGKTWSGTLIGVLCGGALGSFVAAKGLPPVSSMPFIFGLSLLTATIAQAGDMFESWMKRRFGVKDSGRLIPGHGGFMDRLDGFIAAAVFAVVIGLLHHGVSPVGTSVARGLFNWD
jgi:phosphatidate cytidylyltransferase